MSKPPSNNRSRSSEDKGVYTKDEARARGLQVRLRTRDGDHLDPLALQNKNPGIVDAIPTARKAALEALSILQVQLKSSSASRKLDVARAIFEGANAVAAIEAVAHRMNFADREAFSTSPNPLNFDRGGVGPDIALDLNVSNEDRERLRSALKGS